MGAVARADAGRAKHHDGVADLFAPQPHQGIDVFGENAHRPRGHALHEESVAIGGLRYGRLAAHAVSSQAFQQSNQYGAPRDAFLID